MKEMYYNVITGYVYDHMPKNTKYPERYYAITSRKQSVLKECAVDYFSKIVSKNIKYAIYTGKPFIIKFWDGNNIPISIEDKNKYSINGIPNILQYSYMDLKREIISNCIKDRKELYWLYSRDRESLFVFNLNNIVSSNIEYEPDNSAILHISDSITKNGINIRFDNLKILLEFILKHGNADKLKFDIGELAKFFNKERKDLERKIKYAETTLKNLKTKRDTVISNYNKLEDYEKLYAEINSGFNQ